MASGKKKICSRTAGQARLFKDLDAIPLSSRRDFLQTGLWGATAATLGGWGQAWAGESKPPNIVLFLIDDLGWTDVGCFGNTYYRTPHIDRLASEGIRFTDGYAACPVCSPTRASIMTGKYPARLHLTDWIPGHSTPGQLRIPDWTRYLAPEEITIAEALKKVGYVSASIGKWHLGGTEKCLPQNQGFSLNLGGTGAGQPPTYFSPYKITSLANGPDGEYLTDRLGQEACRFIEGQKDKPFFLYLSHFAVHTPIQGKPDRVKQCQARWGQGNCKGKPAYAAMVENVDDSAGEVLAKLKTLGLEKNTVIIFTSDNGGYIGGKTTENLGLRAGKGSAYEGGVRVPWIIKWPGVVKPGSICHVPVISPDLFPTILEMGEVGAGKATAGPIDGVSLLPLLKGQASLSREAIFWHYPHYNAHGATPFGAVRSGDWRLIEFYEDRHLELYNLKDDLGETQNAAETQPGQVQRLREMLHAWRTSVNAQMPTPANGSPAGPAKGKREKGG